MDDRGISTCIIIELVWRCENDEYLMNVPYMTITENVMDSITKVGRDSPVVSPGRMAMIWGSFMIAEPTTIASPNPLDINISTHSFSKMNDSNKST